VMLIRFLPSDARPNEPQGSLATAAMGNLNLEDSLQSNVLDGQFHEPNYAIEVG
jgi:hypothetical protein